MAEPDYAAIACERILDGEPVLFAQRDEPMDDEDSGWQFTCGGENHGQDEGQENGHVVSLKKLVEDRDDLARLVEMPVGAEFERESPYHAWERMDIDEPPEGSFVCSSCGETHDALPMDLAFEFPTAYYVEEEFPRDGWVVTEDTAVFRDEHFWIRGVLEIPVLDAYGPFCFGVWVSASKESFEAITTLELEEDELEGPFFGWFQSELRDYPDSFNLKCHTWVRGDGLRPLIELEATDDPLSVDHRQGITLARVHELVDNL